MNKIKAAIVGYGNIGRFVLESLQEATTSKSPESYAEASARSLPNSPPTR